MIMKKLSALLFGMALLSLLPMKAWSQEAYGILVMVVTP